MSFVDIKVYSRGGNVAYVKFKSGNTEMGDLLSEDEQKELALELLDAAEQLVCIDWIDRLRPKFDELHALIKKS